MLVHLRDTERADPLDPKGGKRQLMVQLWYPTDATTGPLAPYAPAGEAAALQKFYPVPAGAFTAKTNSHLGAPLAGRDHPVVFFHHGLCGSRTDSTIVAEDLASRGYVVVALGNTGESAGVEFPDGAVVGPTDPAYCQAGSDPFSAKGAKVLEKLLAVRVADVRFVADQLAVIRSGKDPDVEGAPLPKGLGLGMDLTAMGIYGHSFGGGTAAAVAATDRRFVAGIDLDGFAIGPTATQGVGKPFLVVGVQRHDTTLDPSWKTFLPALAAEKAWHRWYSLQDSGHYRFIDLGGSIRRWGLDKTLEKQDPTTWAEVFGNIDDATSQRINRTLVGGFFDQFLRGTPSAVLTDPTSLPDVRDRRSDGRVSAVLSPMGAAAARPILRRGTSGTVAGTALGGGADRRHPRDARGSRRHLAGARTAPGSADHDPSGARSDCATRYC
ncbi:dienelactone hydrolase [Nakamurella sp. UYEF19]|uniref:alpha/beta hydrolase n=1 Tax=Nakamurella sp. UYEF19 TaxID=1756392 RepID=UPI003397BB8F